MELVETPDEARYTSYPAPDDLRGVLQRILHGWSELERRPRIRIPPTGGLFISYVAGAPLRVHFSDRVYDRRPRYFIGGKLRREHPLMESLGPLGLFGCELAPTGFYRLFHRTADGFTDDIADFAALFPEQAAWLDTHLDPQVPAAETVAAFETFFRQLQDTALETSEIDAVLDEIAEARGMVAIADIARKAGLSERQLHRAFVRIVGIPPKHHAKIVQIQSVMCALEAGDSNTLASLAADHGYFDQSHFIRDFKRYIRANPVHFLRSGSDFLHTYILNMRA